MTWTVTKETSDYSPGSSYAEAPNMLNVRAIINCETQQAELKDLIASLQKHVKDETT